MMRKLARPVVVAVAAVVLAAVLVGCDALTGDDDGDSAEVPSAAEITPGATPGGTADATQTGQTPPEEALRLFVQRRLNQGFVPNCDDAKRPDDVGKQCARLRAKRDGLLAFELGPTFGEYTRLLILQPIDGTWTIVHSETRDVNQPPPQGIPWPLVVGANVIISGTGDCLRVHEEPGVRTGEAACLDDGTAVTITDRTEEEVDGFDWWFLEGYGWAVGDFLRYPDDGAGAPVATPEE